MTTITLEKPLTNLQMELLKLFSRDLPEERLLGLKQLLADFLQEKKGKSKSTHKENGNDASTHSSKSKAAPPFEIQLEGQTIGLLPGQLFEVKKSIDAAFSMLSLEADWDDEGAGTIDKSTFARAIHFVVDYSNWLLQEQNAALAAPQIHPGPDGSIDILWRTKDYRMLINIPQDAGKQAEYYGDDKKDGNSIKGRVPTDGVKEHLALWLNNLKT